MKSTSPFFNLWGQRHDFLGTMRFVSSRQMREIDAQAREKFGIPEIVLMEHAGTEVAKTVLRILSKNPRRSRKVLVLSGGGANGGDGFVTARHLDNQGIPVEVVVLANRSRISGAALIDLQILRWLKVPVAYAPSVALWRRWSSRDRKIWLAVDALLGTGIEGPVREPIRSAIGWLNRQRFPIVSVDLPSGLSSETGLPCGAAVQATLTVTCGFPKLGLRAGQGRLFSGRVVVADIGLPRALR